MDELELALAVSARPWADRLHRHTLDHGGARVRVRVIGRRDALEQDYGVLLIDDTCSFLDRRLVDDLLAQGKGVLAVVDGAQAAEATQWVARLGVTDVVGGDASPEQFLEQAAGAVRSRPGGFVAAPDPGGSVDVARGRLVAVMGCSGGVGATEIAIATASAWPGETILVDLDTVSPSMAQRLGLRLLPNLRSALQTRRKVVDLLEGELHRFADGVRVLPGLASSSDWREVRGPEVTELLADLRQFGDLVVNLPAGIPTVRSYGEQGALDPARAVLGASDVVVAVTVATPVGVSRLFEWAAAARSAGVERPAVLFNMAPRSTFARAEITREVGRVIDPLTVGFLPGDGRVRRAGWDGREVRAGPFARAVTKEVRQWARM